MPLIPAVCDSCGTIFSSGIYVENVATLNLHGNKSGPCPSCGRMGSVISGTFSVAGKILTILSGPQVSHDVVARLNEVLRAAREMPVNSPEVRSQIENLPGIGKQLAELLPDSKNEWYTFLGMLLALLTFLYAVSQPAPPNSEDISTAVQKGVERGVQSTSESMNLSNPYSQTGRNQPCQCGSGKKYKNCCGGDDLSPAERLLRDLQNSRQHNNQKRGGYST